MPAEVGALTALLGLDLSVNQLSSVPAELGSFTALKGLDLSGNQLTSVPAALGGLSALLQLRLSGNQLNYVPAELGRVVQVDPLKPTLKAPGCERLKLRYDELLSSFAFNFNLRRYSSGV